MPEPDPLAAFFLSLDEQPGDRVTLLALADWYDEQDHSDRAACLRWAVGNAVCPFRFTRGGGLTITAPADWHEGWYWWALDDPYAGRGWGHPLHCRLPLKVWRQLEHTFHCEPSVFKEYPSGGAAWEALLEAWPRVGPLTSAAGPRERWS
jgi:uncharacterized protein (TIGR02996 family)